MQEKGYDPETYWTEVAGQIAERNEGELLAGDNEPYYAYKREKFLELLHKACNFKDKTVLEIGSGPGGNVQNILNHRAKKVVGADISSAMIALATRRIKDERAEFVKIDGKTLPFPDKTFDLVFTATVLQHNTNDTTMRAILAEACRVCKSELILFEKLDSKISGTELCLARPVAYYAGICAEYGFELINTRHINIRVSYFVSGAIRKVFNPGDRKEGEPITGFSRLLQKATLLFTKPMDTVFHSAKDVGGMVFKRIK